MDKAGREYWDHLWMTTEKPHAINLAEVRLDNYVYRGFHEYFTQIFSNSVRKGQKLLEVGCARSIWLPYFAKEFGFEVCGIDYSEIGCQQAKQVLSNEDVGGEIICADFFFPPRSLIEAFDVVVSFGVLEHFKDTAKCIAAFSKFLKPGALLITIVPNMVGLIGLIQKYLNRDVFDIHMSLFPEDLRNAHLSNGLKIVSCDYFLFANFGVLNLGNSRSNLIGTFFIYLCGCVNRAIWTFEKIIPVFNPNRWSSPYICCVAIKA